MNKHTKKTLVLILAHLMGFLIVGYVIWVFLCFLYSNQSVFKVILILVKIICLLISVAYFTIAERKVMAAIQRRRGPNVVGF
jgi:cytochrome c biogenesis protein CcdA